MESNKKAKANNYKCNIVLLHGWGGSKNSLQSLSNNLEKAGHTSYVFDLPGFGQEKLAGSELFMDDYIDFIFNFIDKNKIKNPVLLGHSFGGKVAIGSVLKNQSIFKALILVNSSGINPKNSAKKTFLLFVSKVFGAVFSLPVLKSLKSSFRKVFYKVIVREGDYHNANELKKTLQNVLSVDYDNELEKISLPTQIIWAQSDSYTPLWMGKKLHESIKNSKFNVVENQTHNLPLKRPDIVAKITDRFLTF